MHAIPNSNSTDHVRLTCLLELSTFIGLVGSSPFRLGTVTVSQCALAPRLSFSLMRQYSKFASRTPVCFCSATSHRVTLHCVYECSSPSLHVCVYVWRQELTCVVYTHCRQLDKFKPAELCNLVWGVAQLTPQADVDLLQEVLQASATWSEVSTHALAPSKTVTHSRYLHLHCPN